jgi:hypothetical protein
LAVTVPNWLLGRHVAQVQLFVQNVAADGTLSDTGSAPLSADLQTSTGDPWGGSTPLTFTATLVAEVEFSLKGSSENISALDRPKANNVRVGYGAHFTVTEILRNQANKALLAAIYHNGVSRYVRILFARGGNYWQTFALMVGYTEEGAKGRNTGQMTLAPVGIAPTYNTGVRGS